MKEEPIVNQPTEEEQRIYQSVRDNTPTMVTIPGTRKRYKIRWLKYCQTRKLGRVLLRKQNSDEKDKEQQDLSKVDIVIADSKIACKAAAIFVLDGMFKLHFLYWFLWRWFYFVKEYRYDQLLPILTEGKKKVPLMQYFGATTSLIGVKDTLLQMTTKEVERILQELGTEQPTQQPSTESGSSAQDTSSSD